jgi:uncharacterized membrane protein YphA (DoxX/SURF4 family)
VSRTNALTARPPARAVSWLAHAAPAERIAAVRVLVAAYVVVWLTGALGGLLALLDADPARWQPVGVLAPFGRPPTDALVVLALAGTYVGGVAFALGAWTRLSGPLVAVCFLLIATYRSSWGQIFHTDDLVMIHLAILALAPVADAWGWDARRRRARPLAPAVRYGWPLRLMSVVTVLTYVLAGVAKLRISGTDWVTGTVLRNQVAQDNLLKELFGAPSSPLAGPLLSHAWLFPPMAAFALIVELGAPVALLGGWWRNIWVAAAWVFHLGVLVLMTTFFPYPLSGVAFASMFALERGVRWINVHRPRHRGQSRTAGPLAPADDDTTARSFGRTIRATMALERMTP